MYTMVPPDGSELPEGCSMLAELEPGPVTPSEVLELKELFDFDFLLPLFH